MCGFNLTLTIQACSQKCVSLTLPLHCSFTLTAMVSSVPLNTTIAAHLLPCGVDSFKRLFAVVSTTWCHLLWRTDKQANFTLHKRNDRKACCLGIFAALKMVFSFATMSNCTLKTLVWTMPETVQSLPVRCIMSPVVCGRVFYILFLECWWSQSVIQTVLDDNTNISLQSFNDLVEYYDESAGKWKAVLDLEVASQTDTRRAFIASCKIWLQQDQYWLQWADLKFF